MCALALLALPSAKAYGDGRAVSLGEWETTKQGARYDGVSNTATATATATAEDAAAVQKQRWELQLKGGGTTPFARGHDGRAVLRSSVREFLVSEGMHALKVRTTRALSLIASKTDSVRRAWYVATD